GGRRRGSAEQPGARAVPPHPGRRPRSAFAGRPLRRRLVVRGSSSHAISPGGVSDHCPLRPAHRRARRHLGLWLPRDGADVSLVAHAFPSPSRPPNVDYRTRAGLEGDRRRVVRPLFRTAEGRRPSGPPSVHRGPAPRGVRRVWLVGSHGRRAPRRIPLVSPMAHMPARFRATRRTGAMPLAIRIVVALALPLVAALTVAGTYLGLEIIVGAAWVALAMVGVLLANPVMGIVVMVSLYLLSAYPTVLQAFGFLTVQNLLGVGFVVSL